MWWDILKNAKIRGKGKTGGKLDTSRLKVNVEDNSCEKDFRNWLMEQSELNEMAFTFPIEVELQQVVNDSLSGITVSIKSKSPLPKCITVVPTLVFS